MEERGWAYRRRQPEGTVLYEAVKDNLATLLEEASEVGRGLPRYVERDFARYLECGVLAHCARIALTPAAPFTSATPLRLPSHLKHANTSVETIWAWGDLMNGLQVFPNLVGLVGLSGVAASVLRPAHASMPDATTTRV
ncbi:hypothetical protein [Cystobacter fuscus]|uniref:hypothetical protein n=1 Tax=Cystobacter fuscus TaxID=43 RepID=UPI0012DE2C32|nr:hypothetical protein [Cystobacter fuscus]